jgi:hypothetical protein
LTARSESATLGTALEEVGYFESVELSEFVLCRFLCDC